MRNKTSQPAAPSIDPATTLGPVQLTVADAARTTAFYERAIGLHALGPADDGVVSLGIPGGPTLVQLVPRADAPPRAPRSSGLFHTAILVPSRGDLALALRRLAAARWPLTGASDHLVSEALYLDDPEGNGIELYRDRPREEWRRDGGQIAMATLPLDLDAVLAEAGADVADAGMPAGTRIGHVHLQVSDLGQAEAFYHGVLGFDVMTRAYPGALFVSAGGYHHHLGLNAWGVAGGPAAVPGARGLRRFVVELPDDAALDEVRERLSAAGAAALEEDGALVVTDPFGNEIALRRAAT